MPGQSTPDTKHRFIFKGWDSEKGQEKTLREETILYNGDSIWDIVPKIEGTDLEFKTIEKVYTFAGWTLLEGTLLEDWENIPEESIENIPEFVNEEQGKPKTYVYRAAYSSIARPYEIIFQNYNGEILQNTAFGYDSLPAYSGATPQKEADKTYTYSFKKWSPEISNVVGKATYTATFNNTYIPYTITWKDQYGTELRIDNPVHYGDPVSYGPNPTKESSIDTVYTFDKWSPDIVKTVEGNATYTALYKETVRQYSIKFIDWDGTALNGENGELYDYNTPSKNIKTPTNYSREGWSFVGWGTISDVKEDKVYQAQYKINKYTITFKGYSDFEGNQPISIPFTAEYGAPVILPTGNKRVGYDFVKWSGNIPQTMPATNDLVFEAQYEIQSFKIIFDKKNGESPVVDTYNYGEKIILPSDPELKGNNFIKWLPDVENFATKAETYVAQYEPRIYTLTFIGCTSFEENFDDKVEFSVTYDTTTPDYPIEQLAREGYNLIGWETEKPSKMPDRNVTIKAIYEIQKFQINFIDHDGKLVAPSGEYKYNDKLEPLTNLERTGYGFTGWLPEVQTTVQAKADYEAQYTPKRCQAIFKNDDDPYWDYDPKGFDYDGSPYYSGSIPLKGSSNEENFSFSGWVLESEKDKEDATLYQSDALPKINVNNVPKVLTEGVTFVARFEASIRYYTIPFKYIYTGLPTADGPSPTDYPESKVIELDFEWNESIIPPTDEKMNTEVGAPVGYTFNGWNTSPTTRSAEIYDENKNQTEMHKSLGVIDKDTKENIYYVIWSINKYTVTFANYVIKSSDGTDYESFAISNGYRKSSSITYNYGSTPNTPSDFGTNFQSRNKDINFINWQYSINGYNGTNIKIVEENITYNATYDTPWRKYWVYWFAGNKKLKGIQLDYGTTASDVASNRPEEYRRGYTSSETTVNGKSCAIHSLAAETAIYGHTAFRAEMWSFAYAEDINWDTPNVKSSTEADGILTKIDGSNFDVYTEGDLFSNKDSLYRILDLRSYLPNADNQIQTLSATFKCKINSIAVGLPTKQVQFGIINGNGARATTGRKDYDLKKTQQTCTPAFYATSTNSDILGYATLGIAVLESKRFFLGVHTVANGTSTTEFRDVYFTIEYHNNQECAAQVQQLSSPLS